MNGPRVYNAFVDPSARLAEGVVVWHGARVLANVEIQERVSIGGGAEIGRESFIGHGSRISAGVFLPSNSLIGNDVFIGPNATFTDDRYPRVLETGEEYKASPPVVRNRAAIGANATILPGVTIGTGAMVGAGAVVTEDVADGMLVVGVPARAVGRNPNLTPENES